MTPLEQIADYLKSNEIFGFFSIALLVPARGRTQLRASVNTGTVDPYFDHPSKPKIKQTPKEKNNLARKFRPLMRTGATPEFSLTKCLSKANRRIPLAIFDKELEDTKGCHAAPDDKIFTYFLGTDELLAGDPRATQLWDKLRLELEIDDIDPSENDLLTNFNKVLVKPRSELRQQCVLLLPVVYSESLLDFDADSPKNKKAPLISEGIVEKAASTNVFGAHASSRFLGLLNVTCCLPKGFKNIADLLRILELPRSLAMSHLVGKLLKSYDDAATAAARATVFARNFSHVIGSHVISNPDFRIALTRPATRRNDQREAEDYEDTYKETAKESLLENSRTFHEYLQGRFDFIARAIDETQDHPEPVFFVLDLLEGFLKQSAFLDTFVADLGVRLSDMSISVELPGDNPDETVTFKTYWETDDDDTDFAPIRISWAPQNTASPISIYDRLVGIPGGMVSAHAFYSILENIIRNSVKYGKSRSTDKGKSKPYDLKLALYSDESGSRAWRMSAQDTYSIVTKLELDDIKERIKPTFIYSNGSVRRDSLGLLEMQSCATGLYRAPIQKIPTRLPQGNLRAVSDVSVESESSPRCAPLIYEFNLNKPILLAIVGKRDPRHRSDSIRYFSSLEDLARDGRGAHIAAIEKGSIESWPVDLDQRLLPYRLLGFDKAPAKALDLPERRVQIVADNDLRRRVFATDETIRAAETGDARAEDELILDCYEAWLRQWKANKDTRDCSWDLWIGVDRTGEQVRNTWANPLRQFSQRYTPVATSAEVKQGRNKTPFVNVAVRAAQKNPINAEDDKTLYTEHHPYQSTADYWARELAATCRDKKALIFDNHGACFLDASLAEGSGDYRRSSRFYQKVSGSQTPELFRVLSHPPASYFGFTFFVFGLVEACLANVVVVDERVAADLLFPDNRTDVVNADFGKDLAEHQKAGVFPVFSFGEDSLGPSGYYTLAHRRAIEKLQHNEENTTDALEALQKEGVRFRGEGNPSLRLLAHREKPGIGHVMRSYGLIDAASSEDSPLDDLRCDAIVIHEGVLDLIGPRVNWPRGGNEQQKIIRRLWKLSPLIVRTSGRGRFTKHFPQEVPFVEFSEVSSSLLTARNKLTLVRSLLGASGEKRPQS